MDTFELTNILIIDLLITVLAIWFVASRLTKGKKEIKKANKILADLVATATYKINQQNNARIFLAQRAQDFMFSSELFFNKSDDVQVYGTAFVKSFQKMELNEFLKTPPIGMTHEEMQKVQEKISNLNDKDSEWLAASEFLSIEASFFQNIFFMKEPMTEDEIRTRRIQAWENKPFNIYGEEK